MRWNVLTVRVCRGDSLIIDDFDIDADVINYIPVNIRINRREVLRFATSQVEFIKSTSVFLLMLSIVDSWVVYANSCQIVSINGIGNDHYF